MVRFFCVSALFFYISFFSLKLNAQSLESIKDSIDFIHKKVKEEAYTNSDLALVLAEKALKLSKANKLDKQELQSYYSFGLVYYYKGFYKVSNDYYKRIAYSPKSDFEQQAAAWNNMGINYELLGMLDSALFAYQKSRAIDQTRGDRKGENMTLINIGLLNYKLVRHDLAISQTHRAKKYFESINDNDNLGLCYLNLGVFHDDLGQDDSCKMYYDLAATTYIETKDYPNLFQTYLNQTNFWIKEKNKASAEVTFQKAKDLIQYVNTPFYQVSLDCFAARIYQQFGPTDSAIYYSLKALRGYDTIGVKESAKKEYFNLSMLYAEKGKIEEFKQAMHRYDSLGKEILNEDINHRVAEMEVKYNLDVKDKEIENAKKSLAEQTKQIFAISIIALFLLISLIIMYLLFDKIKAANKSLYEKNIELMGKEKAEAEVNILPEENAAENTLLMKFKDLLTEKHLYKNPELTLKMAAMELGTNEKYLSQAINNGGSDNFNTFVNRFRINEARRMILDGETDQMSIEELAGVVGFSNRHTFSRAFTQITGISPSEFRKIYLSKA